MCQQQRKIVLALLECRKAVFIRPGSFMVWSNKLSDLQNSLSCLVTVISLHVHLGPMFLSAPPTSGLLFIVE